MDLAYILNYDRNPIGESDCHINGYDVDVLVWRCRMMDFALMAASPINGLLSRKVMFLSRAIASNKNIAVQRVFLFKDTGQVW